MSLCDFTYEYLTSKILSKKCQEILKYKMRDCCSNVKSCEGPYELQFLERVFGSRHNLSAGTQFDGFWARRRATKCFLIHRTKRHTIILLCCVETLDLTNSRGFRLSKTAKHFDSLNTCPAAH